MSLSFALLAGAAAALQAEPPAASEDQETETIVVQATRAGRRVGDEPTRVDVLNRDEIEEKILMRPGNIATILRETGGLRDRRRVEVDADHFEHEARARGLESLHERPRRLGLATDGRVAGMHPGKE